MIQLREFTAVAHQTAGSGKNDSLEDRGNAVPDRRGAKVGAGAEKKLIVSDDEASCLRLDELSKDIAKVTPCTRPDDLYLRTHFLSGREGVFDL